LYASSSVSKDNFDEIEHVVTIPSSTAFAAISAPFELRIVPPAVAPRDRAPNRHFRCT
jgi:hypothetical protein